MHIDFPEMAEKEESAPNDFYVFKGQNKPTVIHIPLFNIVNCGGNLQLLISGCLIFFIIIIVILHLVVGCVI